MTARRILLMLTALTLAGLACQAIASLPEQLSSEPEPTATRLPSAPVLSGAVNPDEPVFITGLIPFTSPFFLDSTAEPFVLLEDQTGFVRRDRDFEFLLAGQAIGPVEFVDEQTLRYSLALPSIPQGNLVDVDNNDTADPGVQIFAVAYWSNTWGGPFLERRDGHGWSTSYTSVLIDSNQNDEIVGGRLLVWSPDERQSFPTGFGQDGLLFTADDPVATLPAGYNLIDLDQEPFRFYKEAQPEIDLLEGASAVADFSSLSYAQAFEAMVDKASREYPFTAEKQVDWQALQAQFAPLVAEARNAEDFYRALRAFTLSIPDGHIGVVPSTELFTDVFLQEHVGGYGFILAELSDGRVIVTQVFPDTEAARAGIQPGAQVLTWDDQPIAQAIGDAEQLFRPHSTGHANRLEQVKTLFRVPIGTRVRVRFQNPNTTQPQEASLEAEFELESYFQSNPFFALDELSLPVEAQVLDDVRLGYIRIHTFSDDYNLIARLWDSFIQDLIDNEIPGLIIDLRVNPGGNSFLANDFAGYFFETEEPLFQRLYYNERTRAFEPRDSVTKIIPGPTYFDKPVAVLIGPECASACEGLAHALSLQSQVTLVGHSPTAGMFGEVGRGQYSLPEDISVQFPTGRPETLEGELLIEGVGVQPDILVPITEDSAMGKVDAVLEAAIEDLLNRLP